MYDTQFWHTTYDGNGCCDNPSEIDIFVSIKFDHEKMLIENFMIETDSNEDITSSFTGEEVKAFYFEWAESMA